jgi:hypothetical protein
MSWDEMSIMRRAIMVMQSVWAAISDRRLSVAIVFQDVIVMEASNASSGAGSFARH